MKALKDKVSLSLDIEVVAGIKALAEKDDRTLSQYINIVLKEHLAKKAVNKKP